MDNSGFRRPLWALTSALLLTFSGLVAAEPPSRAARLGMIGGEVSFAPAGQPDWVQATVNRPLTTGDRLWTADGSRAELQIGGTAMRMGASTNVGLLNLDDRIAQVQLLQGSLKIRVRSLGPRQTFEVATPNLAVTLSRIGEYRIEVDPDEDATTVTVKSGDAEVYGDRAAYTVDSRAAYRFYGTDLSDYETVAARPDDELDRWSRERDRRGEASASARYVSPEVVGYEDLDAGGTWRADATYGYVWAPRGVASDWSPYRDGHWSWVDPWGWTWVDDAPWGYAVSHYGRWANINGSWAWVPGPRTERAVYAPALVAFVGGRDFQVSVSVGSAMPAAVGWFPLAPREVYQPSYAVSRGYFDNINRSNAVIAPAALTNVYNTTIVNNTTNVTNITNVVYANQQVRGAVVAVPAQAFVQSQPVAKATVKLAPEAVVNAPVVRVASVAPVQQSVQGGAREAVNKPTARERVVVARTAPPAAPLPFAAQQAQLAAKPGTPIDEAQRTQLKPAAPAATAPKVSVVATAQAPTPTALPPATPPAGKSAEARKAAAAKAEADSGQGRKPDADRAQGATAEALKAEESKATAAKADAARATDAKAVKPDADKVPGATAEASKAEESKAAAARADAAKAADPKSADTKADESKAAAGKVEAARPDARQAAAARAATKSVDAQNAAAAKAKTDATQASNARAEAGKVDEGRVEQRSRGDARAAASRAEETKADAKAESTRAEAAKSAMARVEAAKAEAARTEAARVEAAKAGAAKAEAARAESAKANAARADDTKLAAARAEAQARAAARAKEPAAAPPPKPRASGPKSNTDASPDEEKGKEGHKS